MINRLTWVWLKKEELEGTFLAQRSQSRLGSRRNCSTKLQPQKTGPKYSKNLQGKMYITDALQLADNIGLLICSYTMCNLDLPRSFTSDPSSVVILSALKSTDQRIINQIIHLCTCWNFKRRIPKNRYESVYLLIRCIRMISAQRWMRRWLCCIAQRIYERATGVCLSSTAAVRGAAQALPCGSRRSHTKLHLFPPKCCLFLLMQYYLHLQNKYLKTGHLYFWQTAPWLPGEKFLKLKLLARESHPASFVCAFPFPRQHGKLAK